MDDQIDYQSAELIKELRCPFCFTTYDDAAFELCFQPNLQQPDDIKIRVGNGGEYFSGGGSYHSVCDRQDHQDYSKPTVEVVALKIRSHTNVRCSNCGGDFMVGDIFLENVKAEWFTVIIDDDPENIDPNNVQRSLGQKWQDYCWRKLDGRRLSGHHDANSQYGLPTGATIVLEDPGYAY